MQGFLQTALTGKSADIFYLFGRYALAIVFLWSGMSKAYDPDPFADTIAAYGLLPDPLVFPAAIFLIVAELLVGIGLLIEQKGALAGMTLLMLLFISVLGYGIVLGLDVDCGCFGPNDPEIAFHDLRGALYRDLVLLLIIGYLYVWRFANRSTDRGCEATGQIIPEEV